MLHRFFCESWEFSTLKRDTFEGGEFAETGYFRGKTLAETGYLKYTSS